MILGCWDQVPQQAPYRTYYMPSTILSSRDTTRIRWHSLCLCLCLSLCLSWIINKIFKKNVLGSYFSYSFIISFNLFLNLLIVFFFRTFALAWKTKSFVFYRGQLVFSTSNYHWTRNQRRLSNRVAPLFSLKWNKLISDSPS